MSYRRNAGGGKRDTAEAAIILDLRRVGADVWQIGGRGNPDLLVRFRRRYFAGEVKTGTAKETVNQGDFPIWRTSEDALRGIGCVWQEPPMKAARVTRRRKTSAKQPWRPV